MKVLKLAALTVAVTLVVSWLSVELYPSVQDFMRANPFWNGLQDFSGQFGADTVASLDQVGPGGEGRVLIAIPYIPYNDKELNQIKDFVSDGGTLVLMDDFGGFANKVLEVLEIGARFNGYNLADPYLNYRNQWLPLIVDLAPELKEAGVNSLVFNHATAMRVDQPSYDILARSSDTSYLDTSGNGSWDAGEPRGPLVVAMRTRVGRGTVIAISDPSILINSMVGLGDNGAFLRYLTYRAGENPRVALDTSHLKKLPLERSKDTWAKARERMASPYFQVLLVAAVLAITSMPVWRKGNRNGSQR